MNGPNDQGNVSPAEYTRRVRATMEQRKQHDLQNRQKYQPYVHSQMQRLFRDYRAPLYARVTGVTTQRSLALAESVAVSFASHYDRNLEDQETQAISEHLLTATNNNVLASFATTGFALFMTWRGRRTMKFPIFTPAFAQNPGPERSLKRAMAHGARLVAYYVVGALTVQPVLQALIFWNRKFATDKDPRLSRLLREARNEAASITSGAMSGDYSQNTEAEYSSAVYEQQPTDSESQNYSDSPSRQSQPQPQSQPQQNSWSARPSISTQQANSNDPWASSDIDDGSPVAPAAQRDSFAANSNVSAWDRVRQQASGGQRPQVQQQPTPPQSWGQDAASDDNRERSQAQRDFDAMLEKERQGSEQENSSWGK